MKHALRVAALAVLASALGWTPAKAQDPAASYPDKPVRLVIPLAPGGPSDILGRFIAQKLGEAFGGAPIYAENRPGAGGTLGATLVAKAPADGYTLLLIGQSTYTINATLYPGLTFDPRKDLTVVTALAEAPQMLVVNPSLPVTSVQELIAYAKERPGKLSFASGGIGTGPHLIMEVLKDLTGMDLVHVPYKGAGPGLTDVVAGRVEVMMVNMIAGLPHVKAGRLKLLAVSSAKRSAAMPEVPTLVEAGVKGFTFAGPHLIMIASGTPKPIVDKLNKALVKIIEDPEMRQRLATEGAEPIGNTSEEAQAVLLVDIDRWAKIITRLGVTAK